MTPAQAEFRFIETAHKLDTYGVDPHLVRVRDRGLTRAQGLWAPSAIHVIVRVLTSVSTLGIHTTMKD